MRALSASCSSDLSLVESKIYAKILTLEHALFFRGIRV